MTQFKLTATVTGENGYGPLSTMSLDAQKDSVLKQLTSDLGQVMRHYSEPKVEVTAVPLGAIQTPIASANTQYFVVDEDGYAEGSNGAPSLARAVTLAQEEAVSNERDYYVTVPVKHIKYVDEPHTEVTDIVVLGSA